MRAAVSVGGVTILLGTGLAGCGSEDAAATGSVDTTHRALAAAAFDAFPDESPVAAAPLAPRDGVPADSLGVEVAFDAERGDNVHVTVIVSPRVQLYDRSDCESDELTDGGCVETETDDGDPLRLSWQELAFESDPGFVSVLVRRDDEVVGVTLSGGAEVRGDPREGGVPEFPAEDLLALAGDPAVGFTTTEALLEAGADISDDVWLDWYGQGNGVGPPEGHDG